MQLYYTVVFVIDSFVLCIDIDSKQWKEIYEAQTNAKAYKEGLRRYDGCDRRPKNGSKKYDSSV